MAADSQSETRKNSHDQSEARIDLGNALTNQNRGLICRLSGDYNNDDRFRLSLLANLSHFHMLTYRHFITSILSHLLANLELQTLFGQLLFVFWRGYRSIFPCKKLLYQRYCGKQTIWAAKVCGNHHLHQKDLIHLQSVGLRAVSRA